MIDCFVFTRVGEMTHIHAFALNQLLVYDLNLASWQDCRLYVQSLLQRSRSF